MSQTADICWEARDASVVRALTPHQCGLNLIPDFHTYVTLYSIQRGKHFNFIFDE